MLGAEHLLSDHELTLRQLHQLGLWWVLEAANGAHGLVDGATGTVPRGEGRSIRSLVHTEIAHILGLVVLSRLLLGVRLPPVAFEVAR
jgi:hypothetical protein